MPSDHTRLLQYHGRTLRVTLEPHEIPFVLWMVFRGDRMNVRVPTGGARELQQYTEATLMELLREAMQWKD